MVLVIVGVLAGILFGLAFLGYKGWILGTIIGGLAGLVLKQINRIDSLERLVKVLTEQQTTLGQQVAALQKPVQDTAPNVAADVARESVPTNAISGTLAVETVQIDLPDLDGSESSVYTSADEKPVVSPWELARPSAQTPSAIERLSLAIRRFFTEGNPIVRVGMVVMFFGVSFLVKYASNEGLLPIEFRLAGVLLGAIALLAAGWKTRHRQGAFGLVLQGGGIAIIYLTLFAAAKIYGLLPLSAAFGLLFLVVMLGVLLALLQNAQVLAVLATAGGFLAPILTSTGDGSHIGLFTFYLVLNLGILAIAVYKAWRLLNWVGFVFTFVITSAWGILKYEPVLYATTQPFLIAFFALYLAVSILFSFKQSPQLKGLVDGSLVFGLPLVGFGLQTALLKHTEHGLALSAISLAAIYVSLAAGLARRHIHSHRVLIESFLALGIGFATLTIPLALDASWTSVTWALEATGLVWVGLRQNRLRPRCVGYLLHIAAAISLVVVNGLDTGEQPIINGDFLVLALLALSSLAIAYLLNYFQGVLLKAEKAIAIIAMGFGIAWWFLAGILEISAHTAAAHQFAVVIVFSVLSMWVIMRGSTRFAWPQSAQAAFILLPFITLFSAATFDHNTASIHPLYGFGLLSLLLFFAFQYWFLYLQGKDKAPSAQSQIYLLIRASHILTAWLLFALIFWEARWQQDHYKLYGTAGFILWFAAFAVPCVLVISATKKWFWPFNAFEIDYKNWIPAPLFLFSGFWFVIVCSKTIAEDGRYLPLLNALDLGQFAVILLLAYAVKYRFMDRIGFAAKTIHSAIIGAMLFVWVNVVTLRAMNHYQHIPYDFPSLWSAAQVQMALSILWAICALLIMNLSRRLQHRTLWMIGAALIGVVVLKLFTKDLTDSGTLARIVSFMVVGGLMLLIGYLSPIPAKQQTSTNKEEKNGIENDQV